jgi:arsenate reductase (thioredoxin)
VIQTNHRIKRMPKRKVLFLCTGNSCRSQMAEGLLRHFGGDDFEASSAGTNPVSLNPDAVAVMKEVGIDISRQQSKHLQEFSGQHIPYVITVCDKAKDTCPVFPSGVCTLHWGLEDPAAAEGTGAQRLSVFRQVRDKIQKHVLDFIAEARSK